MNRSCECFLVEECKLQIAHLIANRLRLINTSLQQTPRERFNTKSLNMNKFSIITAVWSVILILAILSNSEAYVTSLTAKRDQGRKANNIRYLQKMRRMKLRLERELQSKAAFEKKVAYFKRWLRKFERKVIRLLLFNHHTRNVWSVYFMQLIQIQAISWNDVKNSDEDT